MQSSKDKPLREFGPFDFYKLQEAHIEPMLHSLSEKNLREMRVLYRVTPYDALMSVKDNELVHSVFHDGTIVAICGVDDGQFWVMFSKHIKKVYRSLVKHSPKFIEFYHAFYEDMYSDVWIENEFIHNWLAYLGFHPEVVAETSYGEKVVRFVRCKSWYDDIGSKPSRPVMH